MRIAVLVIGAPLALLIFLQGCTASALEQSIDKQDAIGGWGVIIGFAFLVASGLAISFPLASCIIFALSSLVAFLVAAGTIYDDMAIWGCVGVVLAIMAFVGWRGKRRVDARNAEENATMQRAMSVIAGNPHPGNAVLICPQCGASAPLDARFCPSCGFQRASVT